MKKVPFYSQIIDWAGEDSGFPNETEIRKWEMNCCGIACVRMVIDYFTGSRPRYWDLLQLGLKNNAYVEAGWVHQGLVEIAGVYGVKGRSHRNKTVEELRSSIDASGICIASVTKGFRGGDLDEATGIPHRKGGHLILAFDRADDAIVCHYPSSFPASNKEYRPVDIEKWRRSFSGNFMEFSSNF
jgi:hypothetical protein